MKQIALIFVAALFMAACNLSDSVEFSGDLSVGEIVEGALELESPDTFYFEFGADTYIYGVCNQVTVDVEVSLYDSAGTSLGKFDGPGEGPEDFYFEISEAGKYMLEIAPFEEKTGDYTLELKIVEPLATDPAKRSDQLMYAYSAEGVPGGDRDPEAPGGVASGSWRGVQLQQLGLYHACRDCGTDQRTDLPRVYGGECILSPGDELHRGPDRSGHHHSWSFAGLYTRFHRL